MNNRYLFRAKRIDNGEWVKGSLFAEGKITKIIRGTCNTIGIEGVDVNPETICQCTGLKDKNGNLIWENDIMVAHLDESCPDDKTYQKIIWNESGFHSKEKGSEDIYPIGSLEQECFEVIGNIFDNPELLESEG